MGKGLRWTSGMPPTCNECGKETREDRGLRVCKGCDHAVSFCMCRINALLGSENARSSASEGPLTK